MTTEEVVEIIAESVKGGGRIVPLSFSCWYGRAVTSAAFKIAKARGLIVVDSRGDRGVPIYRRGLRVQ